MEEEEPLPEPPKRSGAEFVRTRRALSNPIGQRGTHVMEREVGKGMVSYAAQSRELRRRGGERRRMTESAPHGAEKRLAILLGSG